VVANVYELEELKAMCSEVMLHDAVVRRDSGMSFHASLVTVLEDCRTLSSSLFETDRTRDTRKKIASEILSTERTYVRSLQLVSAVIVASTFLLILLQEIIEPLRKFQDKKVPVLTSEDITSLFSYLEIILGCHVKLLGVSVYFGKGSRIPGVRRKNERLG
jgi:hypothetical protein